MQYISHGGWWVDWLRLNGTFGAISKQFSTITFHQCQCVDSYSASPAHSSRNSQASRVIIHIHRQNFM